VQAQNERKVAAKRMARLVPLFGREAGEENLKVGFRRLHPSSVQARL